MTDAARWSLSGRFLRWLFLGLTGVVAVSVGVSAWYLQRSTERELSALLVEELDEIESEYPAHPESPEAWHEVLLDLQRHHPGQAIALRVWSPGPDAPLLIEAGPAALLRDGEPTREPLEETVRAANRMRWRARRFPSGHVLSIALDGDPQFQLLLDFGRSAALLLVLASLLALIGGVFFSRRAASLLHEVADRARAVRSPDEPFDVELPGAPDEIRDVVEALAEMHANVRREADATKLLVAGLAHELRSPLQLLVGSTEVALLDTDLSDDLRAQLELQLDDLHEFGDTVHNLVTLCGPARGSLASTPGERGAAEAEHFDLGEESELRLARERVLAARREVRLVLDREGPLDIAGDREALLRAVRNLAANAVQWSPAGGTVRVSLRGETDRIAIVVEDEGPGLPAELGDRIFEPFVRGPASEGRRAGYGLGLALARTAALAQGGTLRAGAAEGGGARFELTLPRVPSDRPRTA